MKSKTLWIKDEYLQMILTGRKTVEVRLAYSNLTRLEVGDCLVLNDRYPYTIQRIARYPDFDRLLEHEQADAIVPGLAHETLITRLREIYPHGKESVGVMAFEIQPYVSPPESGVDLHSRV